MSIICTCPAGATPPSIPTPGCPEWVKQIQKFALQRFGYQWTDIKLLAEWTAAKAAVDSDKVEISPFINSPEIVAGEAITEGGDNSTLNGSVEVVGINPTSVTMIYKNPEAAIERGLKGWAQCETKGVWYPFAADSSIIHGNNGVSDIGIPFEGMFVSDRNVPGFGAKNFLTITFNMAAGWSDNLVISKPTDFNPLTDL